MLELKNDNIYRIENSENTNYISCLLISLFYNKNIIYSLFLDNDNINSIYIYIQELIKSIINNIKNYYFINSNSLNYLKSILYINNFKNKDILESNKIEDLYEYLYEIFDIGKIELIDLNNNAIINNMTYLNLECDEYNTTIKNLIKKNYSFKVLNNMPKFLAFKINRLNKEMNIDIQKKITLNTIFNITNTITNISSSNNKNLIWQINIIICYDNEINKYFSYINYNNNWLKITNYNDNFIIPVNIKSEEYIIKLKSIFLLYILN
jgi:hypothetical protein